MPGCRGLILGKLFPSWVPEGNLQQRGRFCGAAATPGLAAAGLAAATQPHVTLPNFIPKISKIEFADLPVFHEFYEFTLIRIGREAPKRTFCHDNQHECHHMWFSNSRWPWAFFVVMAVEAILILFFEGYA